MDPALKTHPHTHTLHVRLPRRKERQVRTYGWKGTEKEMKGIRRESEEGWGRKETMEKERMKERNKGKKKERQKEK
jgi:hypothetical protein